MFAQTVVLLLLSCELRQGKKEALPHMGQRLFCVKALVLLQEIEHCVFDRGSGSLDNVRESDGQGIKLCEALGDIVAVGLIGDKLV